jgi:hypothetical protein
MEKQIAIEIYKEGKLVEKFDGTRSSGINRAIEIKGIAYVRNNPHWIESIHYNFRCKEVSEDEIKVKTPIGFFFLPARRAKKGDLKTAHTISSTAIGFGTVAKTDQLSPPVSINGRLCPPSKNRNKWWFQPSAFIYEDGSSSDFLGMYPRDIRWEEEPKWDINNDIA